MRKRVWLCAIAALLAACGDDDDTTPGTDAGTDTGRGDAAVDGGGGMDAGADGGGGGTDSGADGGGGTDGGMSAVIARGDYIVNHVAACPDCHTPRDMMGRFDMTKFLAGGVLMADLVPGDDTMGAVYSRNLTPDMATGLGGASDDAIKNAIRNGVPALMREGPALFAIMPYQAFHNMSDEDVSAVVAYLRSIAAVSNMVPDRQPLPFPLPMPAPPIDEASIPHTTLPSTDAHFMDAERGRYLAGDIGICMDCHTARDPMTGDYVRNRLFAGGFDFPAAELMLPSPPFPMHIFSRNITPDMTGIHGWTPAQVRTALQMGLDDEGMGLCPPMPAGPMGAFGGLTDADALAIGQYITTLPPLVSDAYPECVPPST